MGEHRSMQTPKLVPISDGRAAARARARRVDRAIHSRRRLSDERRRRTATDPRRRGGRAWINGREVGGDGRFAHLSGSFD